MTAKQPLMICFQDAGHTVLHVVLVPDECLAGALRRALDELEADRILGELAAYLDITEADDDELLAEFGLAVGNEGTR